MVDKKNVKFETLHLNKFFTQFVVRNFKQILPELERLLVRSSSNLEVWVDFFKSLVPLYNLDPFIAEILKTCRNLFFTLPEIAVPLINCVTSYIKDEKVFK